MGVHIQVGVLQAGLLPDVVQHGLDQRAAYAFLPVRGHDGEPFEFHALVGAPPTGRSGGLSLIGGEEMPRNGLVFVELVGFRYALLYAEHFLPDAPHLLETRLVCRYASNVNHIGPIGKTARFSVLLSSKNKEPYVKMIQRIQTVFLFGVAACMFGAIFADVWALQDPRSGAKATLDAFSLVYSEPKSADNSLTTAYLAGLYFVVAALAIGSLLSYKNRTFQLKLNMVNTVLMMVAFGLDVYLVFGVGGGYFENAGPGALLLGFYLPPAALLLNSLASRFIMRDEKLVRSMDRLR